MLFNSLQFLFFYPVVTLLYFLLPHRFRWIHLLAASCLFYMAFVPVYILILFFTIIIDYIAGIVIENASGKKRKMFLIISLISNIGILFVFKYYNFFIDNFNGLFHQIHQPWSWPLLNIILPIGLSFHTFQAMSYTIEVYRGNQAAERHFGIYSLYVMFYPQLVAGPIERPQNLLHQFHEPHRFSRENLLQGLRMMIWGMFKKVVIADRLAIIVNQLYDQPGHQSPLYVLMVMAFFSIQIYCDFSGYSDIAIGAAKTMGFDLMTNFNRPYFATNIQSFWARWHISLSTWFRDYLYIPLGGSRVKKQWRIYFNVAVVFLISGFWHGANWTFVIWGGIHAAMIVLYMMVKDNLFKGKSTSNRIFDWAGWALTFLLVTLAWVFFRASNLDQALLLIRQLLPSGSWKNALELFKWINPLSLLLIGFLLAFLFVVEYRVEPKMANWSRQWFPQVLIFGFTLLLILIFGVFSQNSFIYFQF